MARKKGQAAVEKKAKALKRLKVEYVKCTDIKPNTYNPNRQSEFDFNLLLKSMKEDGFTQPVVVQDDLTIVDGEHRWRAAQELGLTEIPVVKVDMTPEQMRIATLRHNRARGSEDIELTAQLLLDLQELGAIEWAQDSLMMDDTELNRMLEDIPTPEALSEGHDWNEAWEPMGKTGNFEGAEMGTKAQIVTEDSATAITAGSIQAIEALRQREADLKEAKTDEEAEMIRKAGSFYRINLLFSDDDAEVVSSVLGDKPAVRLVEICKDIRNG